MDEFLLSQREPIPLWLKNFSAKSKFNAQDFFGSRVVFYPGSGSDGHPVKVFGSTHSAHCFVYADYGITQKDLERALDGPQGFNGYHSLARLSLQQNQILPSGWSPTLSSEELEQVKNSCFSRGLGVTPYAFLEVLERDSGLDDDHGAERLAILFLCADGIATFDALFCQPESQSLFALLIQDHGVGGNYDSFGPLGLMSQLAQRGGRFPQYLLCEQRSAWTDYSQVPNSGLDVGGCWRSERYLFCRSTA